MSVRNYDDYFFKDAKYLPQANKKRMKHVYRQFVLVYGEFMGDPTVNKWGMLRLWMEYVAAFAPQFEPPVDAMAVAILRRYI
jgi:hypothetical protein